MFGPGGGGNVLDKNLAVSAVLFLHVLLCCFTCICLLFHIHSSCIILAWEVMEVTFVFKRQALHFIFRAYVPVILLMIFNFASYWIPHSAIPARVTLIITTFLTITFILQSISAQTAKATTTTSLQIFLIFSVVLVVVAILQFILILYFGEKDNEEVGIYRKIK